MTTENTTDVTDALPTMKPETRSKAKKGTAAIIIVVGVLLMADDQIKRFTRKKTVTLTVVDNPES